MRKPVTPRKFSRYLPVFLVSFLGITITIVTFLLLRTAERDRVNAEVIRRAATLSAAIQRGIDGGVEAIDATGGFFDSSIEVTREEFKTFARVLLANHREIQALEWVPLVNAVERPSFEEAARKAGYSEFRFTELIADDSVQEAGERAEYYPVYYVEPFRGNEPALGYDLGSEAVGRQALEIARDSGAKVATARIVLVQDEGSASSFLIFRPVYRKGIAVDSIERRRENLFGFVLGVFRVSDVIDSGIRTIPASHFDIYVEDDNAFEDGRFLYSRGTHPPNDSISPGGEDLHVLSSLFTVISPKMIVEVPGRRWLVHFVPTQQLLASVARPFPLEGAALVFLFTTGTAGYMFMRLRRLRESEAHSQELQRRLEFERVVSAISSRFSKNYDLDAAINESLRDVGRLSAASRAYLFLLSEDGAIASNTHEWCSAGVSPQIDNLKDIPSATFPWWMAKLGNQHTIHLEDVSRMPPEAAAEQEMLQRQNIKSLLVLPVFTGAKLRGFVGFDNVEGTGAWDEDSLAILRVAAAIIGNALERKQSGEEIQQQNRLLKSVFEAIPYAFYVIDTSDYAIKMANSAARLGGLSQGVTCYALTHQRKRPCDAEGEPCPLERVKRTRRPVTVEHIHYDKAGNSRTVEVYAYPILDTDGNVIEMIEFCLDVTERKKMQEQLIMQDRLASIGQLVSGVAHEVNNPLTSIIGFSDLMLERELPGDIKGDLEIISQEAHRTAGIVKNLLTFARKQPQEKQPVDINETIQRVLELRAYEQKVNNIQVNTSLGPGLPRVLGNSSQLQQVFFNIMINAEYFMLEAHKKGTLAIASEQRGDIVWASFADDGTGITRENLSRLFTPFFTTKEAGKGTGLGLSICHGIVSEHGGRIWAESEAGEGSTFIIELPTYRAEKNG